MTTRQLAHGIAKLGRNGDSVLVHMQPQEVAGLQALAKSHGTSMTVNPHTGLPEAFSLGGFFSSLLPVFAGGLTGGMGAPLWAGIAAGAATGAATSKDPLSGALMGGLGGYSGFGLGSGLSNMGAVNAAANPEGFANAAAINASNAAGPTAVGNSIADGSALLNQGVNPAITQGITQAGGNVADPLTQDFMKSASENLARSGQNLKDVATMQPGAWDSFKQGLAGVDKAPLTDMQAGLKLATPLGGAVLGGLEPSDLYGTPKTYDTSSQKYDPLRTLNLNTNTGLRLLASGGPVSFADGGDANKELSLDPAGLPGGGVDALKGADMVEVTPGGTKLGIFATAEQIDAAKKADELARASQGRGLGSLQDVMDALRANPTAFASNVSSNLTNGRFGTSALSAPSATTAKTASTGYDQLAHLNLNKQYADGGYVSNDDVAPPVLSQDGYGLGRLNNMAAGGIPSYAKGGYLDGPGDGMSDSIPATIEGRQPARLADGEFVIPADVVSHLGNGSTKAGSDRLYGMLDRVRKARTGTVKQGRKINPNKLMPA